MQSTLWRHDEDEILKREFSRGAPDAYIGDKLGRSKLAVHQRRRVLGLLRRRGSDQTPTSYEPTPAEIQAACEKIQETWDDYERAKRSGMKELPCWQPPAAKVWRGD